MELIFSLVWLAVVAILIAHAIGQRGMLRQVEPIAASQNAPAIAVVVPVRDEATNIGACLSALVAQRYPLGQLRVIVVDDHSSDKTASIVTEMAREHACLQLLSSPELPSGWIGESHACWIGAAAAPGDTAIGQFILVRRAAYQQSGGHAAVRTEVCEDAALARLIKRAGWRVLLAGGDRLLSARMYDGWRSLWIGVSKNLVDMLGAPNPTVLTAFVGVVLAWSAIILPLFTGVLEMIPDIGPALTAIIAGLVAVQTATGIGAIIGYAIYATALCLSIDQLLGPLVLDRAARVHPALIIFCFLTGGLLFGVAGVILAAPVAPTIKVVLATLYENPPGPEDKPRELPYSR